MRTNEIDRMNAPLLDIDNLCISFKQDDGTVFEALSNVSFSVPRHATVAVVGESGSGKSVTSMAIMGLLPKTTATIAESSCIRFNDRELLDLSDSEMRKLRGGKIAMINQDPLTALNPVYTVGDQVIETLLVHTELSAKQAREKAIALFDEVGLPKPEKRLASYPHEMSGGQQQRVMIAMAIACEPELLIADEPTTALDVTIQKQIIELLADIQKKRGMSVMFITHDLNLVAECADEVVVMCRGEVCEKGPVESIFTSPKHVYTRALLACRPSLDARPERLPVISDFEDGSDDYKAPANRTRGYSENGECVLDVRNLSKTYYLKEGLFRKSAMQAVKDVSFQLQKGKTLGIVGESGSGKSTVGMMVMHLVEADSGAVFYQGKNLSALSKKEMREYRRDIQIIFQNPFASLNPRFTVGQILLEPLTIHKIGKNKKECQKHVEYLLERVGPHCDCTLPHIKTQSADL